MLGIGACSAARHTVNICGHSVCVQMSDLLPRTAQILGAIDLKQACVADMSDLHEGCGEKDNIGWMEPDALRAALPLDGTHIPVGISMSIHKETEGVIN